MRVPAQIMFGVLGARIAQQEHRTTTSSTLLQKCRLRPPLLGIFNPPFEKLSHIRRFAQCMLTPFYFAVAPCFATTPYTDQPLHR